MLVGNLLIAVFHGELDALLVFEEGTEILLSLSLVWLGEKIVEYELEMVMGKFGHRLIWMYIVMLV